ncbi:MAG: thioredoxin-like domain-containing protein [Cyclobacteriaceae bacterium]
MGIRIAWVLAMVGLCTKAQTGYQLDFKIKGLKDTTIYLGYYYGEQTYIKDTTRVNSDGSFRFDGNQSLPHGVYFIVLNKTRLFEMAMSADQQFSLATTTDDYVKNMKVTGDEDNRLFFENMVFNMTRNKEAEPYVAILRDSTKSEIEKKAARESFDAIGSKVMAYQKDLIAKHPQTVTAKLLNANRPVEVPDPPKKADGTIDSTFQYHYYKAHYFDHFDLADDALIRLPKPIYQQKLVEYLEKMIVQTPDSLVKAIDELAARVKKNQETYKYLVWNCIVNYQSPKIMGLDEVYVRLYDKYIESGEMDFWLNSSIKKNMKDYADKLRLSLIGKTGPNLIMQDLSLQPKSMYDIKKKYTILYIFDPDCGHCREETPKLVSFYNKNKSRFDLEVYAVSADTSLSKMKKYITEMKMTWITVNGPRSYVGSYQNLYDAFTTPSLFILNDQKKIIAKKLPVGQLEDFLVNYERVQERRAKTAKGT